jgi:hypothetical protein
MHITRIGVEEDSDFAGERAQHMARLATLQRLKEEMARNNRQAMMRTLEQMVEAETQVLRNLRDRDSEAA